MSNNPIFSRTTDSSVLRVSVLQWTSKTLMKSTTTAFFGPTVLQIEPTLATIFLQFDNEIWKLLFCSATLVE